MRKPIEKPEKTNVSRTSPDYVSRSEQKRQSDEILRLALALMEIRASEYAKLVLDDELKTALDLARKITSNIAKKRQMLFVAKQLRKRTALHAALFIAVDKPKSEQKKQTAKMHRTEHWRDRLLAEADAALGEFIDKHPNVDRQELRSLVRAAKLNRDAVLTGKHDNGSFNALYKFVGIAMNAPDTDADEAETPLNERSQTHPSA